MPTPTERQRSRSFEHGPRLRSRAPHRGFTDTSCHEPFGAAGVQTASIGAAVTVTQKSRRCGLRRQPAVLIERSRQPAWAFLTEAYALLDYSSRMACVAWRRRQVAGAAMVPAAEYRGQHNGAFVGSLGVRDVPSRDALFPCIAYAQELNDIAHRFSDAMVFPACSS